ncbi:MAG TPA: DUF3108 domain-containing protein [Lacunisphaera sp.]|nr:DUF3108 domain-containing protein [Lacunisphaera sp.]
MKNLLLFLGLPSLTLAAPFVAIKDGETFTYRVAFGIFGHAGDIVISGKADTSAGQDRIAITATTTTKGFVRGIYQYENNAVALIDRPTGRLLSVKETGAEPKRAINSDFTIDYKTRTATYTDHVRSSRSSALTLPPGGDPIDLISALVQTRDWDLKPGDKRDVVVQFGRDFYAITIHAVGFEEVRTPMGKYKTLVLVPRMDKDPKGLFKKGGDIKVWIAQDGSRLPVKMQLKLNFGTASLLLSSYQEPAK